MAKKTVSVGLVNTSWWSELMYLPALNNHPQAVVTAVCGRHPERTRAFAEKWNIPHYFTDFAEMAASGLVEAVVIATPNKSHYPLTMQALEAGLHVFCEKPLALNVAQAAEMTQKAQETGLKCAAGFTYRFMPTARYLKRLLDEGYIGPTLPFESALLHRHGAERRL